MLRIVQLSFLELILGVDIIHEIPLPLCHDDMSDTPTGSDTGSLGFDTDCELSIIQGNTKCNITFSVIHGFWC